MDAEAKRRILMQARIRIAGCEHENRQGVVKYRLRYAPSLAHLLFAIAKSPV